MPHKAREPLTLWQQLKESAAVLALGGAMVSTAVLIINVVATKDWVKEQDAINLARANAYTDTRAQANLVEIRTIGGDVKAVHQLLEKIDRDNQRGRNAER